MLVVFKQCLEYHLGHAPQPPELRCHVLVRSVSPTNVLPRDCLLSESGVQNGEQLEGGDGELA